MSDDFDRQMQQAGERHAAGDLQGASKIYARLLKRDPGNGIVQFFKALADFDLGQRDQAIDTLHAVAKKFPDIPKIRMDLGFMLEREGRYAEALDAFSAASRLAPNDPAAHIMAAHMHTHGDDTESAIAAYRKGLHLHPANHEARVALTRVLMLAGSWDDAAEACDMVLDAIPGHTGAMALKSIICYERGDADTAREIMNFDDRLMLRDISDHCGADALEGMNAALSDAIANHPTIAYEPKDYSTKKGYHTGDITGDRSGPIHDFLLWVRAQIDAIIADCRETAGDAFQRRAPSSYKLNAWGVVMEDQGHQASHIHRDAWLSGVYYPKVPPTVISGDPEHAGWIEFGTPHDYPRRRTVSDTKLIMPKAGNAVFFPSFFYHRTVPLKATETRISIAFDVLPE